MFPALLATLSFALSTVCGHRATKLIGGIETNFWRLLISTVLLALWANLFGGGFTGSALPIFVVSGLFGIGLGDVAFYSALPLLGPRLAVLVLQCLTALFAIVIEWVWLGTTLTPGELLCGAVILTGVAIALHPREWRVPIPLSSVEDGGEGRGEEALGKQSNTDSSAHHKNQIVIGLILTTIAAFGNGAGLVISRKAYAVAATAGEHIDGGTAAYQRVIGGFLVSAVFLVVLKRRAIAGRFLAPDLSVQTDGANRRKAWPWLLANATFGMTVGVSLLQWALMTTPTGIVQSVVSITPLTIIPLARITEGEKPSRGALFGSVLAVVGIIALTWVHLRR